jgi:hypothetical protein
MQIPCAGKEAKKGKGGVEEEEEEEEEEAHGIK